MIIIKIIGLGIIMIVVICIILVAIGSDNKHYNDRNKK